MFHYIDQSCPIFATITDPNDPIKIMEMRPKNWSTLSSSMFFIVGGQHTIHVVKVNFIV